jgi:hypothetical protein
MPRARDRGGRAPDASGRAERPAPRKPRPGLPDSASVVSVKTFTSPKGNRYRIIETNETDAYDPPLGSPKGTTKKRR